MALGDDVMISWSKVQRLIDAGNLLADELVDHPEFCDKWDKARYALAPEQRRARGD